MNDNCNNSTCNTCKFFSDAGYREHEQTKNIGFCSRFSETTNKTEISCSHFFPCGKKEDYESILKRAQKYGISQRQPFNLIERNVLKHEKEIEQKELEKLQENKEQQFKQLKLEI